MDGGVRDMLAFVKFDRGPGQAELRRLPVPEPGPGEVLVRVAGCGICGSDLHAFRADPGYEFIDVPVVLGHELAGTVEALGTGAGSVSVGDPVAAVSVQGCDRCPTCRRGQPYLCPDRTILGVQRDGGLAQWAVLPARHLVPVPSGLDLLTAALAEPLSVAVHAVFDRALVRPGDRVVVSGPGAIGLFCARLASLAGAEVLLLGTGADVDRRLAAGEGMGLDVASVDDPATERRLASLAPDGWIETSGAVAALDAAVRLIRRGGTVTVVGVFASPFEFFPTDAVRSELSMLFSYGSHAGHYDAALALLRDDAVEAEKLVSRVPLTEAREAFEAAMRGDVVKPVIAPWAGR